MTQTLNRRPSMILDDFEESGILIQELKRHTQLSLPAIHEWKQEQQQAAAEHNYKAPQPRSIDDMDMISLNTSFDKQMLLGSPMYLDPLEQANKFILQGSNSKKTILDRLLPPQQSQKHPHHHYESDVPTDASNFHLDTVGESNNPLQSLIELRSKYILSSQQDAKSNISNDLPNWLLYPKPLPKFWRYEYDPSFQSSYISNSNYSNNNNTTTQSTVPAFLSHGKKINYSGERFDLDLYKQELSRHRKSHHLDNDKNNKNNEVIQYNPINIPTFEEFRNDFKFVIETIQSHKLKEIAKKRLQYLLDKFELFQYLNSKAEILENKNVPYRDFYNCRKIDRDLLLSGCFTQRQLSEFIWEKINLEPNRIVYFNEGTNEKLSLKELFETTCDETGNETSDPMSIGLKVIDDEFLEWYNDFYLPEFHLIPDSINLTKLPCKQKRFYYLTKTFLNFDNFIEGEYFAELLIRYVVNPLEKSKYQLIQMSIDFQFYPVDSDSWWTKFSRWLIKWKLISYNIRWNVQISRIYTTLFQQKRLQNFQEFLDMVFDPVLTSINDENWELQYFLTNVCSIELVVKQKDSYIWKEFTDLHCSPKDWTASGDNPTIAHYMYYIFEKISKLNNKRISKRQNTFTLRSYCSPSPNRTSQFGETVSYNDQIESLVANLLLCNGGLLNGESLWDSSIMLPYIFYLFQIPIITAPLSSVSLSTSMLQSFKSNSGRTETKSSPLEYDPSVTETVVPSSSSTSSFVRSSRDITLGEQTNYTQNPFMNMFKMGFKLSISSNSVLYNSSYTSEPIIEEFSVAASIYLLNAADLCELARTSVICSGYDGYYKQHWSGINVNKTNDSFGKDTIGMVDEWFDNESDTRIKHNVPTIRRQYRKNTWDQEWHFIKNELH
ncbi:metallo-dependent hydrolase superfamily protein NDAI_0G05670 [Naumovozyma dairenensis CBS 421]|uniref:Uncharacterized protein n=1 Tax=Naumovozyma dairenensis (strain ATCC 10597 / BCRC 20456 / CBS 421 / NBRC 0211 / NRRL Y-12639) TaxID=1071378 RepID=J7SBT5_NAUDC|nr:hypothetical protein NDAI_0G05670 [Naumovozyma dairenensis CBS 421]CCK73550.1 hypothetical protein NDAI_0G05670 [Naumovozyma dairenensis CBS 421]